LVCCPRASSATTSASLGQSRRALDVARLEAAHLEHRRDGIGVEGAVAALRAQPLGGLGRRPRPSVRPRLGHRVKGVGRREQPSRRRQDGGRRAAVYPEPSRRSWWAPASDANGVSHADRTSTRSE
jgi:hypothetical protein